MGGLEMSPNRIPTTRPRKMKLNGWGGTKMNQISRFPEKKKKIKLFGDFCRKTWKMLPQQNGKSNFTENK